MNDFLIQIASYLDTKNVGVFDTDAGRNIFVGNVPPDPDECICILGLIGEVFGESKEVATLQFPRFQVLTRSRSYESASDLKEAVRTQLHAKYGVILPDWRILRCHAEQEGGPIGKDKVGRFEFTINFTAEINAEQSA